MFYFFSAQLRTDFVQACVIWGEQYYGLYQFYLLLMSTQLITVPAYVRADRHTRHTQGSPCKKYSLILDHELVACCSTLS